jgi:hypothetical protein
MSILAMGPLLQARRRAFAFVAAPVKAMRLRDP